MTRCWSSLDGEIVVSPLDPSPGIGGPTPPEERPGVGVLLTRSVVDAGRLRQKTVPQTLRSTGSLVPHRKYPLDVPVRPV